MMDSSIDICQQPLLYISRTLYVAWRLSTRLLEYFSAPAHAFAILRQFICLQKHAAELLIDIT